MLSPPNTTIFAGPRGSGRTTALINWAMVDQTRRGILVRDDRDRDNVTRVFSEANHGIVPNQIGLSIWANTPVLKYYLFTPIDQFGVDNYDTFASDLHVPLDLIKAVTLESSEYTNIPHQVTVEEIIAGLQGILEDLS